MANPSTPLTTITQIVALQQQSTLMERAAIVRYLRRRFGVTSDVVTLDREWPGRWLAEVVDAIEAGAHLYDSELFTREDKRS